MWASFSGAAAVVAPTAVPMRVATSGTFVCMYVKYVKNGVLCQSVVPDSAPNATRPTTTTTTTPPPTTTLPRGCTIESF